MPVPLLVRGSWTFQELLERDDLPGDGHKYEVVDGNLVVTPPPEQLHQFVGHRLRRLLERAAPPGWEVLTELSLVLGTDGRVPDLAVVRDERLPTRGDRNPVTVEQFGLVAEVESPSSRKTDSYAKTGEYAEAGIPLYWRVVIDPEPALHVHQLRGTSYVEVPVRLVVPWGDLPLDRAAVLAELGLA